MDVLTTDAPVTPPQEAQPAPVPVPAPSLLDQEAEIREALIAAEQRGEDVTAVKVGDVLNKPPVDVPEKFQTPTGEADVDKIKASTRQLDEAIEKKETQNQKTVEDFLTTCNEKYAKFRSLPNPQKLAGELGVAPAPLPVSPQSMTNEQLMAQINADYQRDPIGTQMKLNELMVERLLAEKVKPLEQDLEQTRAEREQNRVRQNLKEIVAKDSRVLRGDVYAAINAKLEADPDLWKLKNPHKAAWLEVKDEMHLGEPTLAQAQPSKSASPILGGGTPPPPQSSGAGPINPQVLMGALKQGDLKDPKQLDSVERAFKEYMDKEFRAGR